MAFEQILEPKEAAPAVQVRLDTMPIAAIFGTSIAQATMVELLPRCP
jgi:hypothetical protein